jgi:glycosyltransferase involved in cell wall biosynthesis
MKVLHLSQADIRSGAGRAAYRIHDGLRRRGVESELWVNRKESKDWTVLGPPSDLQKILCMARSFIAAQLIKRVIKRDYNFHSLSLFPSELLSRINSSEVDVVNLHWVQGEMLSISDISRIQKPVVWTLHDMWAFCGAEHYSEDDRWRDGYRSDNRPKDELGFDLNRWTWLRKLKHWKRPVHIVTPSRWLEMCVRESLLMRNWPVSLLANPINTETWKPVAPFIARKLLGLSIDAPLLLFGALGQSNDPRKGLDLLLESLGLLRGDLLAKNVELLVFGQSSPQHASDFGLPIRYLGEFHDDMSLRLLYSAADVMVVPSRRDNLPNTAVEAHACGTPVVAFRIGGLPDIVEHKKTGYLADPFDTGELAQGILWTLKKSIESRLTQEDLATSKVGIGQNIRQAARIHAVERFSEPIILNKYESLYRTFC